MKHPYLIRPSPRPDKTGVGVARGGGWKNGDLCKFVCRTPGLGSDQLFMSLCLGTFEWMDGWIGGEGRRVFFPHAYSTVASPIQL